MATKNKRRALGRGLDKLIPVITDDKQDNNNGVNEVEISSIVVNPYQPRLDFDDSEIKNLADSIKNQGLLQPIVLRKKSDVYEIISGERRFRAFKFLGKNSVPAIVKIDVSDTEMLEMALVENIQRENLNDIEVGLSYQKLLFDCGLSHKDLSERVGKSRSAITNTLRLLKLPENIQNAMRENKISSGHGRALLSITDENMQQEILKRIIDEKLSVRDIENFGREKKNRDNEKNSGNNGSKRDRIKVKVEVKDPDIVIVEDKLRYHFGTDVKISVNNTSGKGKVEISCYSREDLNRIIDLILKVNS